MRKTLEVAEGVRHTVLERHLIISAAGGGHGAGGANLTHRLRTGFNPGRDCTEMLQKDPGGCQASRFQPGRKVACYPHALPE